MNLSPNKTNSPLGREGEIISMFYLDLFESSAGWIKGDDAAWHESSGLLIASDSIIEDVHFRLNSSSPTDIACKLVQVNVSDIWVKGGSPEWALLNLALPQKLANDKKWLQDFSIALKEELKAIGTFLVGGDTTASSGPLHLSLTLFGISKKKFIGRNFQNSKPTKKIMKGDLLVQFGSVGAASSALTLLQEGKKGKELLYHRRPKSPLSEFKVRKFLEHAAASIDQSDSVITTLWILARANKIKLRVEVDKIKSVASTPEKTLEASEDLAVFALIPHATHLPKYVQVIGSVLEFNNPSMTDFTSLENCINFFYKREAFRPQTNLFYHFDSSSADLYDRF